VGRPPQTGAGGAGRRHRSGRIPGTEVAWTSGRSPGRIAAG
jgi:hypothetical protein